LVAPDDVEAMAAAVPAVLALDRELVHEYALAQCSASAMVNGYLDLYRAMIGGASLGTAANGTHDRLLHPPSGPWAPEPRYQHQRAHPEPGYRSDVA
ncbi:MAG: glycosyltransferase family 4 protein, partial [Mycobacterium sp.]